MEEVSFKERLIKNVGYNVLRSLLNKIGGLIFVILAARLLLPELFGLYSIVLYVVVVFGTLTDLGICNSLIRFVSYSLSRKNVDKARQYFRFLFKVKLLVLSVALLLLLILSWPISNYLFDKPELFYPLLAATLYLLISQIESFFETFFFINKEIKYSLLTEGILQIFKIIFTILSVYLLKGNIKIVGIFLGLAITYGIMLIIASYFSYKRYSSLFQKVERYTIEKGKTLKFLGFMTIATISFTLFGSIDTLVLSAFVSSQSIGYYKAAFSMVSSLAAMMSIVLVLFPLFTELNKKKLNLLIENVVKYMFIFMIPLFFCVMIVGHKLITLFLGIEYANSVYPLYALAFLILLVPLIGVYHTLLQARGLAKVSAKIIIWSLGLNIVLTYLFAKLFLSTGEITIILAVAAAVTISQLFLLIASIVYASKRLGIYFSKQTLYSVIKPIIASIVMALLVRMYLNYFNGRFHSLIAVVVGIVSYFIILFLIKGLGREDWNNLKLLTKVK